MDLVTRGRLSVQRVSEAAWTAIESLAEKGGWDEASLKKRVTKAKSARRNPAKNPEPEEPSGKQEEGESKSLSKAKTQKSTKKRKRNTPSEENEDEDDKEEGRRQRKSSRS